MTGNHLKSFAKNCQKITFSVKDFGIYVVFRYEASKRTKRDCRGIKHWRIKGSYSCSGSVQNKELKHYNKNTAAFCSALP